MGTQAKEKILTKKLKFHKTYTSTPDSLTFK